MDLLPIIGVLLAITLLGVFVAFSPMLIVMDLVIVLKSRRPLLNSVMLTSGVVLAVYIVFLVASQVVSANSAISLSRINDTLRFPPYLDIFAGILLGGFAYKMYIQKKEEKIVVKRKEITVPGKPLAVFAFSFFRSLVSVSNIFAALLIARLSVTRDWGVIPGTIAILWALIVGIGPFLYIGYLKVFKKKSLLTIDEKLNGLLAKDTRFVVPITLGVISLFLIGHGIMTL